MNGLQQSIRWLCFIIAVLHSPFAFAQILRIAVSGSIYEPIETICQKFSQTTRDKCQIIKAPTGHLYAHVMHGMSYDLFISSDKAYTEGLISAQKANPHNRWVFAKGKIVLWSAADNATAESLYQMLTSQGVAIIIANPGASTFGVAAKEVLGAYGIWPIVQSRVVYGKTVMHTYDLVASKRIPLGFVSLSQLSAQVRQENRYWEPDPKSYKPVLYEAIVLNTAQAENNINAFISLLRNEQSCAIFQEAGFNCAS